MLHRAIIGWVVKRVLVLGLLAVVAPPRAQAEAPDPARSASARAQFEEGVKHTDAGAWSEAADSFRRALALRDSPVIRYNLGAALLELGQLVEASELMRSVQIDDSAGEALRRQAASKRELITPRLARLTVLLRGAGVTVELNGNSLAPEQLGVALTVDPGPQRVRALRGDQEVDVRELHLSEGQSEQLELVPPVPPVATPKQAAESLAEPLLAPAPVQRDAPAPTRRKRLWWSLGGAALVATAAVVTTVLLASRPDRREAATAGNFDPPSVGVRVPQ